ncbi:MAG: nucleotidyltransferase [Candidatus Symbiothrix sp.]|jgi:dTDP-glucose pyrophosphorylase|nr:nucleotidyltransferase [Candidatus Symbiothrix sp.]
MKPTLFVLAAGMGSRYGGLKQLDGLGPNGETIMDYSIYDAIRGGFGKVVFVIRKDFEQDFRDKVLKKYENSIPVDVVFQSLDDLPEGFSLPADRTKPWGTNHAVIMGKKVIKEPFAVINADDFYGRESFKILADYLQKVGDTPNEYSMVGYRVGNTLSESGSVARGVCATDKDGFLTTITERTAIERIDGEIQFKDENGKKVVVADETPVSMNFWGFTPEYFDYSEQQFVDFLTKNLENPNPKAEFFIPLVIDHLIATKKARVKVLDTPSKWFGVTYAEDRASVVAKIQQLVDKGEYPAKLTF